MYFFGSSEVSDSITFSSIFVEKLTRVTLKLPRLSET
jgi:hypothetical protein